VFGSCFCAAPTLHERVGPRDGPSGSAEEEGKEATEYQEERKRFKWRDDRKEIWKQKTKESEYERMEISVELDVPKKKHGRYLR
jgi:hypothetical protein